MLRSAQEGRQQAGLLSSVPCFDPASEKRLKLAWRPEPELCHSLAAPLPNQRAQPVWADCVHCLKGSLVGEIVAQKGHWPVPASLGENRIDRTAFVAARAQFYASLEVEQGKALHPGQWLEELAGPLLDLLRLAPRNSTPVHDYPIGFVFEESAQAVALEELTQLLKPGLGCRRRLFELPPAIRIEPLGPVEPPDLKRQIKAKHGLNLGCGTAGNYSDTGLALPLNLGKQLSHSGPRPGLESVHTEGRQRPIVIEQQHRGRALCKAAKKSIEPFGSIYGQSILAFNTSLPFATRSPACISSA